MDAPLGEAREYVVGDELAHPVPPWSLAYAMVVMSAFSACLESRRVCWTTIGRSDSMRLAYSVALGTGSGSWRSLKRTCLVRLAGTVTVYGPAGSRSAKYRRISTVASSSFA